MAKAWDLLMKRLGYQRYVAQGGDWGAFVVDNMGLRRRRLAPIPTTCLAWFLPRSTGRPWRATRRLRA